MLYLSQNSQSPPRKAKVSVSVSSIVRLADPAHILRPFGTGSWQHLARRVCEMRSEGLTEKIRETVSRIP